MSRTADKPGTFRIFPKNGTFVLSGVHANGERVKVRGLSKEEADAMASRLFSPAQASVGAKLEESQALDDFGLPPLRVSPGVVASATPPPAQQPIPQPATPTAIDKAKKAKNAQSLMELVGMGWAAGTVMAGRKLCDKADKDPVKPSPRQVNDLADSAKDTLTEWFGDRDIKPWQMTILLTAAIPLSMLIQSPKKKEQPKVEKASTPSTRESPLPPGAQNPPPAPLRSV